MEKGTAEKIEKIEKKIPILPEYPLFHNESLCQSYCADSESPAATHDTLDGGCGEYFP